MTSENNMKTKKASRVAPAPLITTRRGTRRELIKCLIVLTGNTLNCHQKILDHLRQYRNLEEVSEAQDCHVILVFCPIVSRAGTDIESALKKLNEKSDTKPAVLMVLHHTFDPNSIVSVSRNAVERENTETVDILFHEDRGLLKCSKNDSSLTTVRKSLKKLKKRGLEPERTTQPNQRTRPAFESDSTERRRDAETDGIKESTPGCFPCFPIRKKLFH